MTRQIAIGKAQSVDGWPGRKVEYSEPNYACSHLAGAGHGLGDRGRRDKRFNMATELGAYLDPLADKALIVSIYVTLGIAGAIPRWLVILVVSRDIMIVSAIILSWLVDNPVKLKPLTVSKLNTVAQILLALVVLASLAFEFDAWWLIQGLTALVAILTLASVALYLREWVRHMNGTAASPP